MNLKKLNLIFSIPYPTDLCLCWHFITTETFHSWRGIKKMWKYLRRNNKAPVTFVLVYSELISVSSGVIELAPQYESEKVWKCSEWIWLNGLQMVQFEPPRHWNPSVSSILEVARISLFPLLALWGNRIGSPVWKWKSLKFLRTKVA